MLTGSPEGEAGFEPCMTVQVSARAQGFKDACHLGSIVVPVSLLVLGQISGAMHLGDTLMLLGLVVWLVNSLLLSLANRGFRRGQLIA